MKVRTCLYCGNNKLTKVTHRIDKVGIIKCSRCGVMMVDRISDDTEKLYTSEYFEKKENTKSGYTNYLSSPAANLIGKYAFSRLFTPNIGRHLDLGCADGSLMEIFSSQGFLTSGLEISKDAVSIAKNKGLDVRFSRLHSFPRSVEKSDVITAFDLLEHADKPGVVLKEVYNNLKKGGHFVFSTLSVKKDDPSDYWYSNSLEHYVYYNKENLDFILSEVFGDGNFGFVEIEINGIAEFWGFARKESRNSMGKRILENIENETFDRKNADEGYLLSLFYDQVSNFNVSREIIEYFKDTWSDEQRILASFYNNFYQGKLELAVEESKKDNFLLSATNSIYWQALAHAEMVLNQIRQDNYSQESTNEIIELREQLFKTRNELQSIKNARLVGKIIKTREFIGSAKPRAKKLPKRTLSKILPHSTKHRLVQARERIQQRAQSKIKVHVNMDIEEWDKALPLISVVIPYYNRHDTIDDTLLSLSTQTFINFEIIIVDDGSDEVKSIHKLDHLKAKDTKLKIIHQNNQGVAMARNNGISISRGRYIICLDSDDLLEPTYIEKAVVFLETHPSLSLFTSDRQDFGVFQDVYRYYAFNPIDLYKDNMVITAAAFSREAWESTGGYKSGIGYEDWEFWLSMSEKGYWGKHLPETLFKYRVSMQSRFVEDKDKHWSNIRNIHDLHPGYKAKVKKILKQKKGIIEVATPTSAFINLGNQKHYLKESNGKANILITIPWMTFGGAETLIYNFCREIKEEFNITFMTGQKSDNEWEYKFREITPNIYHLANLFENKELYLEFISNYIKTREINILHIIHNGFTFWMLPELKMRHPKLKVILTLFNDRVPEYVKGAIEYQSAIDTYTSDNNTVKKSLLAKLQDGANTMVIPNGINVTKEFNPTVYDRNENRNELGIGEDEIAIFYVGRLSEEKNPDVFVKAAIEVISSKKNKKAKFFLVGDGPMRGDIERMIKENASDKLVYLGYQSEVAKYMGAADIFVLPSKIEGFPLSLLEAMAMELVVVASDVGAVGEVIEVNKDGFTVRPGYVKDIVEIVTMLCNDTKQLEKVKVQARKSVEKKYSNKVLGKNYKRLYRDALK